MNGQILTIIVWLAVGLEIILFLWLVFAIFKFIRSIYRKFFANKSKPDVEKTCSLSSENAPGLAATAVSAAKELAGVDLDYSIGSVKLLEDRILGFRAGGDTCDTMPGALTTFGCYVGEVIIRNVGGIWSDPKGPELGAGFLLPGIRFDNEEFCDPIGKTFKLMQNGPEGSLVFFVQWCQSRVTDQTPANWATERV